MSNLFQVDLLRHQLRKKEAAAKAVPYVSFILTHVALVLFLLLSFFIDGMIGSAKDRLTIMIALALLAVAFLASEWIYAIITSRRWKKDLQLLLQVEEEQRHHLEREKIRRQEEVIVQQEFKNRILQEDLSRQRHQSSVQGHPYSIRSMRPPRLTPSFPPGENTAQPSFPPLNQNTPRF